MKFHFECDCCRFSKWSGEASPQAVERYKKVWEAIHGDCGKDEDDNKGKEKE